MDNDHPAHSENSPSAAEGWSTCADYINANRGLPDVTSLQAAEGTMAHQIRNECLMQGLDADGFVGQSFTIKQFTFTWTDDDAMLLQRGIDAIRAMTGKLYGEHWVDLTEWLGHDTLGRRQGGTLDTGIVLDDGTYVIEDEKWGRGIPVTPRENKQLQLYALGFGREHGVTDPATPFVIRVDQPRHAGGGGEWRTTWGDLLRFGDWIRERAAATRAAVTPRTASNAGCLWCRRKEAPGGCPTFETYIMDMLCMDLDDLDAGVIPQPYLLTPAHRRTLIEHEPTIVRWLEQLREAALADALAGQDAGGLKAVAGRKGPDRWLDEQQATAAVEPLLRDKSFTHKLKTPTQCAKTIKPDSFDWLLIEPLVKRGERKPILVHPDDERPAIVTTTDLDELDDLQPE